MNVIQYSTNKYGEFIPYELKPALYSGGIISAKKNESCVNSDFSGFGVAITGASCYNLSRMPKKERLSLLKNIYGKEGLNLSFGRLTIGASDYSAELYSYDDKDFDTELKYFSIERDLEYIIPVIKKIIDIRPDIKLFASPWSPPGWMKTGGSISGGHMREKYVDCYAEYFIKYLKEYAKNGIEIFAVTVQNEPETQHFGHMPACIWNPETEAKFVSLLKEKLRKNNMNTEIWINDHSFAYIDKVDWMLENCDGLKNDCDAVAFHYYDGGIEDTRHLIEKYPALKLHFTEGGPRLYDNYDTDWCKWATMMSKTLNNQYSSFTGWNLMLDETGGPNIGPFFCGGLITRNRLSGELSYSGQYKAFKHFAPFVDHSSKIFALDFVKNNENIFSYPNIGKRLTGSLIENKDGSSCLMIVNPNDEKRQLQYFKDGIWWYIELLPETVATVCFNN